VSGTSLGASSLAAILSDVVVVALAQSVHAGSMVRAFVGAGTALASNTGPSSLALALQVYAGSLAGALVRAAVARDGTGGGALGLVAGGAGPALVAFAAVGASALAMPTASAGALFRAAVLSSVADVALARTLLGLLVLLAATVEAAFIGAPWDGAVLAFEFLCAVARSIFMAVTVSAAVI
jgi:hypothetical protein